MGNSIRPPKTGRVGWLNPLFKIELQKAVRNRATSVEDTYRGTSYKLTFDGFTLNDEETFLIQNKHALTPCARLQISRVLDPLWIELEEK